MNKELIPVSRVWNQTCELIKRIIPSSVGRTTATCASFENGLKFFHAVQIPNLAHKYEYRDILVTLKSLGYSTEQAADACGLSYSYAAKLIRQK